MRVPPAAPSSAIDAVPDADRRGDRRRVSPPLAAVVALRRVPARTADRPGHLRGRRTTTVSRSAADRRDSGVRHRDVAMAAPGPRRPDRTDTNLTRPRAIVLPESPARWSGPAACPGASVARRLNLVHPAAPGASRIAQPRCVADTGVARPARQTGVGGAFGRPGPSGRAVVVCWIGCCYAFQRIAARRGVALRSLRSP